MKKIKVTQVKSVIDRPERQKRTMVALGLKKMNASVEVEATPQILGMVRKENHLIAVEELASLPHTRWLNVLNLCSLELYSIFKLIAKGDTT